jgi:capsular polysaccharide biosynthesis protein
VTDLASSVPSSGLVEALWRYRWVVLTVAVSVGLAVYGISLLLTPQYEATSRIVLADPRAGMVGDGTLSAADIARRTNKQAELVRSTRVLEVARGALGGDWTVRRLREVVDVVPEPDVDMVVVTAVADDARGAVTINNSVVAAYRSVISDDRRVATERAQEASKVANDTLETVIAEAEARLADDPEDRTAAAELEAAVQQLVSTQARAREAAVRAELTADGVEFVERAALPLEPVWPRPPLNAAIAVLVALLLAAPITWVAADRNRLVTGAGQPKTVLQAPLLGDIPRSKGQRRSEPVDLETLPSSSYDRAAVTLERRVPAATLLITSAHEDPDTSIAALHLAAAFARSGRSVALVDGATTGQGLTTLLAIDGDHPGLAELAQGSRSLEECLVDVKLATHSATFVPAGISLKEAGPSLRSAALRRSLTDLRRDRDWVIVDSPGLLTGSEATSLAVHASAAVLLVQEGTPTRLVAQAYQSLDLIGIPIVGYLYAEVWRGSRHSRPPEQAQSPTPDAADQASSERPTDRQTGFE